MVLRQRMTEDGQLTDEEMTAMDTEVKAVVEDAWNFADASPEPPLEALHADVLVETTSDALDTVAAQS
jgi:pyruvate dehydrogenase E1 component alpha subunit